MQEHNTPEAADRAELSAADISEKYWHHLLYTGKRPCTVAAFAEHHDIDESSFYQHFVSLPAIECHYWQHSVRQTLDTLHADSDYANYPASQKLLAFLFTYVAAMLPHRSRYTHFFPANPVCSSLSGMRSELKPWAQDIAQQALAEGTLAKRPMLDSQYHHFIFLHLHAVIRYHLNDHSKDFQDTDAFIEKTSQVASQLSAPGLFEAGLDLARFTLGKNSTLHSLIEKLFPQQ